MIQEHVYWDEIDWDFLNNVMSESDKSILDVSETRLDVLFQLDHIHHSTLGTIQKQLADVSDEIDLIELPYRMSEMLVKPCSLVVPPSEFFEWSTKSKLFPVVHTFSLYC